MLHTYNSYYRYKYYKQIVSVRTPVARAHKKTSFELGSGENTSIRSSFPNPTIIYGEFVQK